MSGTRFSSTNRLTDATSLFIANGLMRKAMMGGGWIPLSVYLAIDLGLSGTQLLLLGTSIELAILLGEVPTGVVADTISRKWSVVIGTGILGLAQLLSGVVDRFELFLITQFIWGIGWTFLTGAEVAWFTSEVGSAQAAEPTILRRGRLQFIATIVGIVVIGGLAWLIGARVVVIVAGSTLVAWSLLLAVMMRETSFEPSTGPRLSSAVETLRSGLRHARVTRGLRVMAFVLLLAGMAAEAVDRTNVRRLGDLGLGVSAEAVVVVGGIAIAKALLGWFVLHRWKHRLVGARVVSGFGVLLLLVAVGAFLLAHVPVLVGAVVVLVVQGGLLDATDPLITAWGNALATDAERATVLSLVGQMRAFGEIVGGVVLGTVAAVFTLPVALTCAAVLFGAAGLLTRRSAGLGGSALTSP